jgi:hypothetical protein
VVEGEVEGGDRLEVEFKELGERYHKEEVWTALRGRDTLTWSRLMEPWIES